MKVELQEISVRELVDGYEDREEEGVVGYGGRLDIRPPFQREFVYDHREKTAVIDTLTKDFPLNVMYWAVKEDGNYEIIDGQQRTISISQYVIGDFSFDKMYFHNLRDHEQEQILNYKLMVYFCHGNDREKLDWFKVVNIAGMKLTDQELRNAVYAGSWVTSAKRYFSKTSGPAYNVGGNRYLRGTAIRQDYLETAIKWISNGDIVGYMGKHQHDENADELWNYFKGVIEWIEKVFTKYRKEMKGLDWGLLHSQFKDKKFDPKEIEQEVSELMKDEDVVKKSGIYTYVLTRDEKCLELRSFDNKQKREAYERQNGKCKICGKEFEIEEMEGDHIMPWSEGGKTIPENCQMLCKQDNKRKSAK